AGGELASVGANHGSGPHLAAHGGDEDSRTVGGSDHRAHARPGRHLGGGQLGCHAATAAHTPRRAGNPLELVIDLDDLLDQRGLFVETRVGGEHPGCVGEEDENVGVDEVGDEGGQPVIVTEADLVVGHGVVLVDDRYHAEVQQ